MATVRLAGQAYGGGDAGRSLPSVHPRGPVAWRPLGVQALVPGWAQWSWGQRERGLVLLGSYLSALVVAVFAWGTPVGLAVLTYAFATHAVSTVDAVRQSAFPGAGLWATRFGVSGGLAVGVYAPMLSVATLVAWPGIRSGSSHEGYLVDCRAFLHAEPSKDDWVWYRPTPRGEPRIGRVVAGRGQEVEWSDRKLTVNGGPAEVTAPFRSAWPPAAMTYRVPEGHVLVNPWSGPPDGILRPSEGLVIVDRQQIVGRAWAQLYPVGERRLLD
jgi:hypothetical protein